MKKIFLFLACLFSMSLFAQRNAPCGQFTEWPSQEKIKEMLLSGSKEDGKLDFMGRINKLKLNERSKAKPTLTITNFEWALYQWGRMTYDIGLATEIDALSIYAELKKRKLTAKEKEYIVKGFNKSLDDSKEVYVYGVE